MNKTLQTFLCLGAAALLFGACQKDEPATTVSIRATIADAYTSGESGAKVVVDNTVKPAFVTGDKVWINGAEFTASVSGSAFTLEGSAETPYNAVYPKSMVTSVSGGFPIDLTLPAEQPYTESGGKQVINAPMAATGSGEPQLEFKNVCSLVRVRVRNNMDRGTFTLSSITITASDAKLSGPATISESSGTFTLAVDGENAASSNSVTLTGLTESVAENKSSKDYYIYIPSVTGAGTQLTVKAQGVFLKQAMECTLQYETEETDITINQSTVGNVSMLLNGCDISSMHSAYYFSVAADKKVYFSPGNLQWQGTTGKWRFAEEQWIAYTNGEEGGNLLSENNVKTSALWSDLFCWATSGWNTGNDYYYPYNRRSQGTGTSSNYGYGYGPTGNSYKTSLVGDAANADWGVYNPISNGGNTAGQWRTLTNAEWTYVYTTRTNASALRTRATINGVTGFVLLPDTWVKPDGVSLTTNASTASTNVYTISQWRLLEQNGAIFLPATGYINKLQTDATYTFKRSDWLGSDYGYYWSSTYYTTSDSYCFRFQTTSTTAGSNYQHRSYRLAVRLVQDMTE